MTTPMAVPTPQATPGRRITYTHPITLQVLPGIIASIDEGNLLRMRLDGHRLTITQTTTSERVAYLAEMGTLPVSAPTGRFHPIPEEFNAGAWERVPVHQFSTGEIVALTADHDAAVAAITAYRVSNGWDPELVDLTALEIVWEVFEWQTEGDAPWLMFAAMEGDDQAIQLHRLPVPPVSA